MKLPNFRRHFTSTLTLQGRQELRKPTRKIFYDDLFLSSSFVLFIQIWLHHRSNVVLCSPQFWSAALGPKEQSRQKTQNCVNFDFIRDAEPGSGSCKRDNGMKNMNDAPDAVSVNPVRHSQVHSPLAYLQLIASCASFMFTTAAKMRRFTRWKFVQW